MTSPVPSRKRRRVDEALLMSDEELAAEIHGDRIDILVDLAGHTAYNRLPVFTLRPAAGTGDVDRLLSLDRSGDHRLLHHRSLYLAPRLRTAVFRNAGASAAYALLLFAARLCARGAAAARNRAGYVTFGSFNALKSWWPP